MERCMGEVYVFYTIHGLRGPPEGDIFTPGGSLRFPVRDVQLSVPWGLAPIHCKLAIKQIKAMHIR